MMPMIQKKVWTMMMTLSLKMMNQAVNLRMIMRQQQQRAKATKRRYLFAWNHINPKIQSFQQLSVVGSAEAFKVAGIANGHGLNGTMKWSALFVILVEWQQV